MSTQPTEGDVFYKIYQKTPFPHCRYFIVTHLLVEDEYQILEFSRDTVFSTYPSSSILQDLYGSDDFTYLYNIKDLARLSDERLLKR